MDELPLRETVDGAVITLTLHRPQRRNALSPDLIEALHAAFGRIKADPALRAVVLAGSGDHFCAGGDLAGGMMGDGLLASHDARGRFAELFLVLRDLGKPVVAQVQGDALGGGFGLALACDLIVAGERARFGTPEVKIGLFPWIILATVARNLSRKHTLELLLLGDRVDARTALDWGMVNRVVPEADLQATALDLATRAAAFSPAVMRLGRTAFYRASELPFAESLDQLNTMLSLNTLLDDAGEGVAAFLQKRPPQWTGR